MIESDELIQQISNKLREEKYNVINNNQELVIKLPMFCSVTAQIDNNHLNIKSRFGKWERSKAIAFTLVFSSFCVVYSLIGTGGPFLVICAFGAIVWNSMQWQKTQRVIDIISSTYSDTVRRQGL